MEQVIQNKAPKPAGLLPKNIQAFVLVGLALLMVLIMALTGHKDFVSYAKYLRDLGLSADPEKINKVSRQI